MITQIDNRHDAEVFCGGCRRKVPAELFERDGSLWLRSACDRCSVDYETLIEDDAELYRSWNDIRRPNRPPEQSQTKSARGCPMDCGLCPDHRQKSCIALIEVTTACDLGCPVCYAAADDDSTSAPGAAKHRPLDQIETMLDACVASAGGKPDILQISGGEPTCHPQLPEILLAAKRRPFKHVMLNTNGLAIGEREFDAELLKELRPRFEVHLQFDGLDDDVYLALRGRPLLDSKLKALDAMAENDIPVTLVATLRRGVNLDRAGDLLRFGLEHPAVRGINYQCETYFGRTPINDAKTNVDASSDAFRSIDRVTQTGIVNTLHSTAGELFTPDSFLPLSCGLACMAYLERISGEWRSMPTALAALLPGNPLTTSIEDLFAEVQNACTCRGPMLLQEIGKRLPDDLLARPIAERSKIIHDNFFHVTIITFLDRWNFNLDRACRECTHIVQPDGSKIPFSAFNTIHREGGKSGL